MGLVAVLAWLLAGATAGLTYVVVRNEGWIWLAAILGALGGAATAAAFIGLGDKPAASDDPESDEPPIQRRASFMVLLFATIAVLPFLTSAGPTIQATALAFADGYLAAMMIAVGHRLRRLSTRPDRTGLES